MFDIRIIFADEERIFAENHNLTDIVTPVKVKELVSLLKETGYDNNEIEYLQQGFSHGFDIGYAGPLNRQSTSRNIPLKIGNETILWNKLMKEVQLG